jgi:protein-tyrosine phosphatase
MTLDLVLSAPVNLRDLGGIAVDGGVIRDGFAIRTDDLSVVTAEVAAGLVDRGLRSVIDLRSMDEVAMTGRGPLAGHAEVAYHHIPFLGSIGQAMGDTPPTQATFGEMYVRMVDRAAPQIVSALAIIAHSPGTTAFHCAAGQDRTGVLAAALLLALGAEHEDIVADYARTGENSAAIQERIRPVVGVLMTRLGFDLDRFAQAAQRTEFSDAPMRALLATLTERHGDPLAPLREAGLTEGLIRRLRERAIAGLPATGSAAAA